MTDSKSRRLSDKRRGELTLISQGSTITGDFSGNNDLLVAGVVEGDCVSDAMITISEDGIWRGNIQCAEMIVAGVVEGSLTVSGAVEICPTARISGTVCGGAIAVGQGAIIDGELRTLKEPADVQEFEEKRASDEVTA